MSFTDSLRKENPALHRAIVALPVNATPSDGALSEQRRAFYARVLHDGLAGQELGDQAMF